MRFHNIERHPDHAHGHYIGYAQGYAVRITRAGRDSLWVGLRTDKNTPVSISAKTLNEMSDKLREVRFNVPVAEWS